MQTIKNPWFNKSSAYSHPFYELKSNPIFEHRGVKVYKRFDGAFLYVLGDTAIAERAGFDKKRAPQTIDEILDGLKPSADNVVKHLRQHGQKGLSYSEYNAEYSAGRMA